ncbi:isomerase/hydrolase [Salinibacter sp. 10B]|uniref:fumarylacetoacetate hydrolase family protein n=1 Tax=Salinibacter sp. 10B TaxID=1923971 RepID=UPI000CF47941|nr:fumarylacetoacetate hydrolase family protein [Salinibacter sp. 10B]PQJ33976.1 isomerase/hydrolase [Salinibacter sp. 10B]
MKITLPDDRTVSIGKLLCIGRNYADHAAEMEREVPDAPMVFLKPSTAVIRTGDTVRLPPQSQDVHHEVEMVAVIGRKGRNIPQAKALDHVAGYAVGLDMTARDLQNTAKEQRHPWSVAKGFDTFAPLGPIVAASSIDTPQALTLQLRVNDEIRQEASTEHMIFSVAELVQYCSQIFTLEPGDLLYTGTPSGVGPVEEGDVLEASASGCDPLRVRVQR